ncbi:hypothetical protein EV665_118113 [Shinella granuli]|uniref:Uncharacterized protein n=1 Tax=Shinella granuli TaxID=323621 RepID=A0A4R2CDW5_SHIGR|nr:hypothetical protein EV665_118113 [Shinella granuli]
MAKDIGYDTVLLAALLYPLDPGQAHPALRDRGGGDPPCQRFPLRPRRGRHVGGRCALRACRQRLPRRDRLDQLLAAHLHRGALGRLQVVRHRPGARPLGPRQLSGDQADHPPRQRRTLGMVSETTFAKALDISPISTGSCLSAASAGPRRLRSNAARSSKSPGRRRSRERGRRLHGAAQGVDSMAHQADQRLSRLPDMFVDGGS